MLWWLAAYALALALIGAAWAWCDPMTAVLITLVVALYLSVLIAGERRAPGGE